jgi:hypothetical protein
MSRVHVRAAAEPWTFGPLLRKVSFSGPFAKVQGSNVANRTNVRGTCLMILTPHNRRARPWLWDGSPDPSGRLGRAVLRREPTTAAVNPP